MKAVDICTMLHQQFGCVMISPVGPAPSDVDIYAPPARLPEAKALLEKEGFILTSQTIGQHVYRRFEDGVLYILDLMSGLHAYTQWQKSFALSAAGEARAAASPVLHRLVKYLAMRRFDKAAYFDSHKNELTDFLRDNSNFSYMDPELAAAAGVAATDLLTHVRPNRLTPWRLRWQRLGRGCSLAFIGPDGSGKGFYIERLKEIGETRIVYMGDWFFVLQGLYNRLMRLPSPYNRIVYLFYLVENAARLLKVLVLRELGFIVLIDRFPGTNRNAAQTGWLRRLNELTFRIFLKPDQLLLLMAPPEVIHARKQELSISEIGQIQQGLRTLLAPTRHIVIETEKVDASLNLILAKAMKQ